MPARLAATTDPPRRATTGAARWCRKEGMTLVRLAARPLLASMFVAGGLDALRNAGKRADAAEPVTDRLAPLLQKVFPQLTDDPTQLVRINGAAQVGAGLLLASGRCPRLSATVL